MNSEDKISSEEQEYNDENVVEDKVGVGDEAVESPAEDLALSRDELMLTLQDAQAKADEHWNQLLRAKAEIENVRRRSAQDLEKAHKYGLEKFALELLPVVDSLELGLSAAKDDDASVVQIREGMELTLKMLTSMLEKFGIKAVNPKNERFDPAYHQAMTMQESADIEPNIVLEVFQKGYLLNDRLLRPAMVVVSSPGNNNKEKANKIDEMA